MAWGTPNACVFERVVRLPQLGVSAGFQPAAHQLPSVSEGCCGSPSSQPCCSQVAGSPRALPSGRRRALMSH